MTEFKVIKATGQSVLRGSAAVLALGLCMTLADVASAAEGGGKRTQAGMSGQSGGHGGAKGERGGRSLHGIFRDITGLDDGEDSDAPDWAGVPGGKSGMGGGKPQTAGSKRGDLFGDLWVILRDDQGVPILSPEGFVQPIAADGTLIPLDAEGAPLDETLVQEVEIGRLNVGRAPSKVLDRRADEVISMLTQATAIDTDAAGRLVLTIDGEEKTIDSPLENLAIYVALLTTGSIPGLTPQDLAGTEFDFLVDGKYDVRDLDFSAALLAAATDKSGELTTDEIAYIDAFLGIEMSEVGDVAYSAVDYRQFTYDRSDAYDGVTVEVLVQQQDGSWEPTTVDVYDAVFGGVDYEASGTLAAYTQAADDAREVIEFIHEYAIPADSTTN